MRALDRADATHNGARAVSGQRPLEQRQQPTPCALRLRLVVVSHHVRRAPAVRGAFVDFDLRGKLRLRRAQDLAPHPSEVDERTAYYRLGELRRYSRGFYALEVKGAA